MKTSNLLFPSSLSKILISLFFLLTISCQDPLQDDLTVRFPGEYQGIEEWQDVLEDLVFESSMIVQHAGSIQDAVNLAMPGDAIYIEPGIYKEAITIDKSDIKLVGLDGGNGEKVILDNPGGEERGIYLTKQATGVEVLNIQMQHFTNNSPPISTLPTKKNARHNRFFKMTRTQLDNNIAHYQFEIRLGKREFDVVRIHRVVRESRPYRPIRTHGEVFMVHGASQDFDDIFLTAGAVNNINPQTSSPAFLASKGIDVWGIDLAWTLVPAETSDFNFMKDWGVKRDVDHTLAAMSLARLIRGLTGQGFGRLNLLGFSYGVGVAYAAAGQETQQHPILRDIKGIIPVEGGMKYDKSDLVQEEFRNSMCEVAAGMKALIDGGTYESRLGLDIEPFGNLAIAAPNDLSPIIPGLSNYQAALFAGAIPGASPPAPFWHFVGGDLIEDNIPMGLLYTAPSRWFYLLTTLAPYMPQRTTYEYRVCQCDEEDVKIDDHLDQISVPIMYIGAGGGFGEFGDYTSSLTSSTDITNYTISLQAAENRIIDYGHADVFMATNAPELVWEPLRKWLIDHSGYSFR